MTRPPDAGDTRSASGSPAAAAPARAGSLLAGAGVVGLMGFGGGSALIPIMEREFVRKRSLLDEVAFLRHTVVANITPGALPVKLAAFAGQVTGRRAVPLLAAGAVALPGTLGTVLLLAASHSLGDTAVRAITHASVGISVFITVLLLGYIAKVLSGAGKQWPVFVAIIAVSALTTGANAMAEGAAAFFGQKVTLRVPQLSAVQLIVFSLVAIVTVAWLRHRATGPHPPAPATSASERASRTSRLRETLAPAVPFVGITLVGLALMAWVLGAEGVRFWSLLALSTITSFGGGEAYIGVADGFFVRPGLVDQTLFYTQVVPIANALPGPILVKVGSGMGFVVGAATSPLHGWVLALAGFVTTIGACCALAMPVLGAYELVQHHPLVVAIGRYIPPVICGLLISVCATMLVVATEVVEESGHDPAPILWFTLVGLAVMTWLHLGNRAKDVLMLLLAGGVSLVALGV